MPNICDTCKRPFCDVENCKSLAYEKYCHGHDDRFIRPRPRPWLCRLLVGAIFPFLGVGVLILVLAAVKAIRQASAL